MPSSFDIKTGQIVNTNPDGDLSNIDIPKNTSFDVKPKVPEDTNLLSVSAISSHFLLENAILNDCLMSIKYNRGRDISFHKSSRMDRINFFDKI